MEQRTTRDAGDADQLVRMTAVSKSFPGVRALDNVDFELRRGRVMGLAGENGSGKSTLMKILAGWLRPDHGVVELGGERVHFDNPASASAAGISLVAQEISVHPLLSVMENLTVGRPPSRRLGVIDRTAARERAIDVISRYGLDVDPEAPLSKYPIRVHQMVSILKMAIRSPQVLVLDEPTSSLGESEVASLFELVDQLRSDGCSVVYITHRLREYFDLCDDITVLRDGVVTASRPITEVDESELVRLMVGRNVDLTPRSKPRVSADVEPVLSVRNLSTRGKLRSIDLDVRPGEVVGIAGQAGSGRSTLAQCLFGLRRYSGSISIGGEEIELKGPRSAIAEGIAYVPEDRKKAGLVLTMSVRDNFTMTQWPSLSRYGILSAKQRNQVTDDSIRRLNVKAPNADVLVRNLSGGNQQKIVIGKWTALGPRLILLDEPTRGIDVGAKSEVYELIDGLREAGMPVLLLSSELPELLHMCDRIAVLHRGRLVGELEAGQASEELITQMAFGHGADEQAEVPA